MEDLDINNQRTDLLAVTQRVVVVLVGGIVGGGRRVMVVMWLIQFFSGASGVAVIVWVVEGQC